MPLSINTDRVAIPSHVVSRSVSGTTVLFNTMRGEYFTLDAVGTKVWDALISATSISAACDVLLASFDADPDTLRADVISLIEDLDTRGLVAIEPAP